MAPTKADGPIEGIMSTSTASTAAPATAPHPEPQSEPQPPPQTSDFSLMVNREVSSLVNRAENERNAQAVKSEDNANSIGSGFGEEIGREEVEVAIKAAMDSRSSSPLSDEDWLMTKSQFAQVLVQVRTFF